MKWCSLRVAVVVALVIWAALAAQADERPGSSQPAWLQQNNVFTWKGTATAPFSGVVWGFSPYPSSELENLRLNTDWWHQRGGMYVGSIEFGNDWLGAPVPDSQAALNLSLDPLAAWSGVRPSLHDPEWQRRLLDWLRIAIDAGADGILVDGYEQNANLVFEDPAGSFDPDTMRDFRRYLKRSYSKSELKDFEIDSIGRFDYHDWILTHDQAKTWNDWPLEGLAAEFYVFQLQYAKDFLEEFRRQGQEYARTTYGRDFVVSDNNIGYYYSADVTDFLTGEFFYFDWYSKTTEYAASMVKIGRAIGSRPVVVLPEVGLGGGDVHIPDHASNLIKFVLADIYSAGGEAIFNDEFLLRIGRTGYLPNLPIDTSTAATYNEFILEHPELFHGLESQAKVGIVYSPASHQNLNIARDERDGAWDDSLPGYIGLSKILLGANIQHDVVYLTDPRFSRDRLKRKRLRGYDCLLVDESSSLSDKQVSLLLGFVRTGGVLVVTGNTGKWDEWGRLGERRAWDSLMVEGTHGVGKGVLIYVPDAIGARYWQHERDKDRDFVLQLVNRYVTPQTVVTGADRVRVLAYHRSSPSATILQLMNTDYDPNADAFSAPGQFRLSILADRGKYWASLQDPDIAGTRQVKTKWKQGYVHITVPGFEAYAVIELRRQ